MDEVIPPTPPSPYDYWPLQDSRHQYCQAPRHGLTLVRAQWVEKFTLNDPEHFPDGEYLSCDDCHEETLRNYLDAMLPDLTEEEIEKLDEQAKEVLASGGYDLPDADPPDLSAEA